MSRVMIKEIEAIHEVGIIRPLQDGKFLAEP